MYRFTGGSVAYFAPDAPAFQEAAELNQVSLAVAQQVPRSGKCSVKYRAGEIYAVVAVYDACPVQFPKRVNRGNDEQGPFAPIETRAYHSFTG